MKWREALGGLIFWIGVIVFVAGVAGALWRIPTAGPFLVIAWGGAAAAALGYVIAEG
jgi:hypothetical protein